MMKTPEFWSHRGPTAVALLPLTPLWWLAGTLRKRFATPYRAPVPVICVGNLTAGGVGKTPLVAWLFDRLTERGFQPAILSRGYGGSATNPLWVDPAEHDAGICGDEPLMLADGRDVMVARDRARGARMIADRGRHDVIIMDDGMQNPYLAHDLEIGVFDGSSGVGNGWLMPAGPLRVPLSSGLAQLDLAVINGADETGFSAQIPASVEQYSARLHPEKSVIEELAGTPLLAFAGIGRPKRFFASLEAAGGEIAKELSFADHHPYSQHDLMQILEDAQRYGAEMITTQKDWMRLPPDWRSRVAMLPVTLEIDRADDLLARVEAAITSLSGAQHG